MNTATKHSFFPSFCSFGFSFSVNSFRLCYFFASPFYFFSKRLRFVHLRYIYLVNTAGFLGHHYHHQLLCDNRSINRSMYDLHLLHIFYRLNNSTLNFQHFVQNRKKHAISSLYNSVVAAILQNSWKSKQSGRKSFIVPLVLHTSNRERNIPFYDPRPKRPVFSSSTCTVLPRE